MNEKKMSPYVKMGFHMLLGAVFGGVLGFGFAWIFRNLDGGVEGMMDVFLIQAQRLILPLLIVITIVTVVIGEITCKKLKKICGELLNAEDEEADVLEYEEEKVGAFGLNVGNLSQALCILVISVGYSSEYIGSAASAKNGFFIAALVFILCLAYCGVWQIRYVKTIQKAHPEKLGDPTSRKFQKQWIESCDEAEKEVIYQSTYKTYMFLNKFIPILLLFTMLSNLFLNTGILAIIVVAVIWMLLTVTYTHSCVRMKGKKAGKIRA